ncbi:MAG: radical SAM protein [Desulfobacteraceae bacterium]|nr:MAG: radical SAM protein [Desulfobacteraceae bacterium]
MYFVLGNAAGAHDTWSRRAFRHLDRHVSALRSTHTYGRLDAYRTAVADIGRVLAVAGRAAEVAIGLGDYHDRRLAPVRSADLRQAALAPERNPYFGYYQAQLMPRISALNPAVAGISINYLSQALCAFALIGMLKRTRPGLKVLVGGGLITSWMRRPGWTGWWEDLVDRMVAGPGETALLEAAGCPPRGARDLPDYSDLTGHRYLSPGFILPFSASDGCWWRRCAFCPERAERRPFRPLPHTAAVAQLHRLTVQTNPTLIHLLDNAVSPALLKTLAAHPPGAPWYGFVRIGAPLDDLQFCRRLAAAGCVMLKIGLESGCQAVLDDLGKGVGLETASRVLNNLRQAGIAAYVYLLFGTPAENEAAARQTVKFVIDHHASIGFLNTAVFNLPIGSPEGDSLQLRDFYAGDLALYRDFNHPAGWHRAAVRRFLDKNFKRHPRVQTILRRDPPVFTSNHAAYFACGVF